MSCPPSPGGQLCFQGNLVEGSGAQTKGRQFQITNPSSGYLFQPKERSCGILNCFRDCSDIWDMPGAFEDILSMACAL